MEDAQEMECLWPQHIVIACLQSGACGFDGWAGNMSGNQWYRMANLHFFVGFSFSLISYINKFMFSVLYL